MNSSTSISLAAVLLSSMSIMASASAQNLLSNPGFESPSFTSSLGYVNRTGTALDGWTAITLGSVGLPQFSSTYHPVGEGLYSVQLDSPGEGLEQTVSVVAGERYDISFLLSAYTGPNGLLSVEVDSYSQNFVAAADSYVNYGFSFLASSSNVTLRFLNAGSLFTYPHLDAVNLSVSQVPEPNVALLLTLGLVPLLARRKTRSMNRGPK